jgi:hypothetical protein
MGKDYASDFARGYEYARRRYGELARGMAAGLAEAARADCTLHHAGEKARPTVRRALVSTFIHCLQHFADRLPLRGGQFFRGFQQLLEFGVHVRLVGGKKVGKGNT